MEDHEDERDTTPRIALRFVVGCLSLARERLGSDLRAWDGHAPRDVVRGSARWHRVVGLCVRAPSHASDAIARGRASCTHLAARLAPWWRPFARSAIARRVAGRVDVLRATWRDEMTLAERVGRDEEARGRDLARVGLRELSDRVFDRLATNPDVQALVATQSASVTSTALDELRAAVAEADDSVSAAFQRWIDDPRAQLAALRRRASRGA
ncbi:hypothetical protein DB32_008224 [Sandaracinus amylolyticus]|uniref:Uncharacterized protein n=1 Tax=Sandaracinus amylolyticus TaxID=927083 RepID=A0A0F6W9T3_9BACT|nr:hypothetical protein DB32_008224 [Sandaracinus amylolyticus]